jgi:hypothetical protein
MSLPINRIEPVTMMQVLSRSVVEIKKLKWRFREELALTSRKGHCHRSFRCERERSRSFSTRRARVSRYRYWPVRCRDQVHYDDKWTSTGNSIVESTRTPGVERVFLLFGKGGGSPDVLVRPMRTVLMRLLSLIRPRYRIKHET